MSKRIDIAWMIRTGRAVPGQHLSGTLSWNIGGDPAGSISYSADMRDAYASELRLSYTRGDGAERESVKQTVRLVFTEPNYGGRRWWMVCPYRGNRVGKLYLPAWGDRFAGRVAWRLGYQCQRVASRDRPFEKLFRLQRKLGSEQGWEAFLHRPKGMWRRTFDRHLARYEELDAERVAGMAGLMAALVGRRQGTSIVMPQKELISVGRRVTARRRGRFCGSSLGETSENPRKTYTYRL